MRCVGCRIESRREWLRAIATRVHRLDRWLSIASTAALAIGVLAVSLWRIAANFEEEPTSLIAGWISVVAFALTATSFGARLALVRFAPAMRRASDRPLPVLEVRTSASAPRAIETPLDGVAYRNMLAAPPREPAPLCVRHAALSRQQHGAHDRA